MSTGFDLDQSPEPGQHTPGTGDEPAAQRSPKRQTLQSLEDATAELAKAMELPAPRGQAHKP
ncbi:uncharacterized protein METZ01_LOCUS46429 [marine metagenome]|uniref:Uncharacterized protein n=1 Tax=marine metagenome TaxID=408172 RepID=A0A381RNW7_9ZZZZ